MTYDILLISVEGVLVHVKSGDRYPRNIADFMPDYNLWYAIKFFGPSEIWTIENYDLTLPQESRLGGLDCHEVRISFISKWLSQISGIPCKRLYSTKGNWISGWGYKGEDEIPELILRISDLKHPKVLYVGDDIEYFKGKGIDTMTPEKFIERYNKNPRKYEKK